LTCGPASAVHGDDREIEAAAQQVLHARRQALVGDRRDVDAVLDAELLGDQVG
jgi:hypothetical protein